MSKLGHYLMIRKKTLSLCFFTVFISISGCQNNTEETNKIISFEKPIMIWNESVKEWLKPNSTISIEGKYIVDRLVLKVKIFDKEKLENFGDRQQIIKDQLYFGNFRDKDGFNLFKFPLLVQKHSSLLSVKPVKLIYHSEQIEIKISHEEFKLIDNFFITSDKIIGFW
jgi:hypothetical protein